MDGFGIATAGHGNAITLAEPYTLDYLINNYPATTLQASGPTVGLPWGEMGNSEVGHTNLGAGRIVGQDLSRITLSIEDRSFFKNAAFLKAVDHVKKNGSSLHLAGMVSPGGVHSFDEHLYALLGLAAENGVNNVYIHMYLDGRDTAPQIALESLEHLNRKIKEFNIGRIVTVTGRFYAMDRAQHWNLTEQSYRAMVYGEGPTSATAAEAIAGYYVQHIYDEMIPPTVIAAPGEQPIKILDNDAIIFFNFRSDRAQQMARAFSQKGFAKFEKPAEQYKNLLVVTMTEYAKDLNVLIAFPAMDVSNGFAEIISKRGLRQYHVAESEKYAHVTVFFNGGIINPFPGEEREIITSPMSNYQDYSKVPEMSAYKVTEALIAKLSENYSFYLLNFANPDMVGHTGNLPASIKAIKTVDECIKRIVDEALAQDAVVLITADHGNIEELLDKRSGGIDKEHSTNPVPLILISKQFKKKAVEWGISGLASIIPVGVLSDVAPTMLELMGIPKPPEMTGINLLPQLLAQAEKE